MKKAIVREFERVTGRELSNFEPSMHPDHVAAITNDVREGHLPERADIFSTDLPVQVKYEKLENLRPRGERI